jgi:hypothetical protein
MTLLMQVPPLHSFIIVSELSLLMLNDANTNTINNPLVILLITIYSTCCEEE